MLHIENYVDEKILTPKDMGKIDQETIDKHYAKPVRGYVVIEDSKGNVIDTPNLVLLQGREFLAQMIARVAASDNKNYLNYKIAYFGVGSGGADTAATPSKIGPYDNDEGLKDMKQIASPDTSDKTYTYLNDGYLKRITADDGNIELISEDHTFTINNESETVSAYTTIKYTMFIRADEMLKINNSSFAFNEAGLFAVQYDSNPTLSHIPARSNVDIELSRYNPNKLCFARFTTQTKWIEPNDSLKITWYILI
jgi:hypothetical protein